MSAFFKDAKIVKVGATPAEYLAETAKRGMKDFTVSSHMLAELLRNAQRWVNGYQSPPSKSKEFGELLDCLALSPAQWPKRFTATPTHYTAKDGSQKPWRNDMRIAEVAAWWEANQGKAVVDGELNGRVHAALDRLNEDEIVADLLGSGCTQVWVTGKYLDKATGIEVPVKGLIDLVPDHCHPVFGDYLVDLKTTKNASPRAFVRDCWNYNYHVQAAIYLDLYAAATGENRSQFIHIVQESYAPYEVRHPILSQQFVEAGRWTYQSALVRYCRYLAEGYFPGYDGDTEWPITMAEPWMLEAAFAAGPELVEPEEEEEPEAETQEVIP